MDLITKAVIMAGGEGSRLKPYTEMVPKPMLDVNGIPLLRIMIEKLHRFGIKDFYLSVNYLSKVVMDYFGDGSKYNVNITYIEEPYSMGTAGSITMADIDEPFLVINGDIYSELDFREFFVRFRQLDPDLLVCCRSKSFKIEYGVINACDISDAVVLSWEEKPIHEYLINCGIYMMKPSAIEYIPKEHFFNMNHLAKKLIDNDKKVSYFIMEKETAWIDMGSISEYERLVKLLTDKKL